MPRNSPEKFSVKQIENLVARLHETAEEVAKIAFTMTNDGISEIQISNSAAYDRLITEAKRWKRSAEDGLDDAIRTNESKERPKKKADKK